MQVISSAGVTATINPDRARGRQGDVVRFAVTVKDSRGQTITGLTPSWSFSPGQGTIDDGGAFVGDVPGTYVVTASLGAQTVDATVMLGARDVRRSKAGSRHAGRGVRSTPASLGAPRRQARTSAPLGGDRIYAIDISNPSNPVVTDSIMRTRGP